MTDMTDQGGFLHLRVLVSHQMCTFLTSIHVDSLSLDVPATVSLELLFQSEADPTWAIRNLACFPTLSSDALMLMKCLSMHNHLLCALRT